MRKQTQFKFILSTLLFASFVMITLGLNFVFAEESFITSDTTVSNYVIPYDSVGNNYDLIHYAYSVMENNENIREINIYEDSIAFHIAQEPSLIDFSKNNELYIVQVTYDKQNSVDVITSPETPVYEQEIVNNAVVPMGTEITPHTKALLIHSLIPVLLS